MINAAIRKKQQWLLMGIVAGLAVIALVTVIIVKYHHKKAVHSHQPNLAGLTTNTDFIAANQKSEIVSQQEQMRSLQGKLKALTDQLSKLKNTQGHLRHSLKHVEQVQQNVQATAQKNSLSHTHQSMGTAKHPMGLSALIQHKQDHGGAEVERSSPYAYASAGNQNLGALGTGGQREMPMSEMREGLVSIHTFTYQHEVVIPPKSPKNYVPAGTFVRAVILGGADANASVNGQSDTSELIFRVLGEGTLPGGAHSHLKNCVVLASVYGDISSERGIVRLQHMTCTLAHQRILDIPVQGWAFYSGKSGIKGVPVMRNGKVLMWAGLSGFLSGIGQSLSQSQSVQSTSALGTTTTVPTSRIASSGLYSGAGTALNKLANYYIKRADQYHPIIEIGAGNVATLVFEKGFSLNPNQKIQPQAKHPAQQDQTLIPQNLLDQIRHSQLGQHIGGQHA